MTATVTATQLPRVVQANICFFAVDILRSLGLDVDISKREVTRRLRVARSHVYDRSAEVLRALARGPEQQEGASASEEHVRKLQLRTQVDEYRHAHPGCWVNGGRTDYSKGLQRFILNLADVHEGKMTQAEFADACRIPLATLKDWKRNPPGPDRYATEGGASGPSPESSPAMPPESSPSPASPAPSSPSEPTGSPSSRQPQSSRQRNSDREKPPAANDGPPPERNATASSPPSSADSASSADGADDSASSAGVAADSANTADGSASAADTTDDDAAISYDGVRFSLQITRIISEYNNWHGTFLAFVRHLRDLRLPSSKGLVRAILHLAAERKLLMRKPPGANTRGSTFRPPPNVQWSTDGKTCIVVIDGQHYTVNWQPMMDVGSGAAVGTAVRKEEDSAGVVESFADGVETAGAPPHFLLADNKSVNKSAQLRDALPKQTTLMHATLARPQNNAVSEGNFGLFAQDLGPVIADIDTSTPERHAVSVAGAVTRGYQTGRNHRPRRKDGRTPADIFCNSNASPEEIADAVERLSAIKQRIDARQQRQEARRDPVLAATLEESFSRFGFQHDGKVFDSLFAFSLAAIQNAIAIYAAKKRDDRLPDGASLRYFAGIVRNCQYEIDLRLFEQELVAQLDRTGAIVHDYLERRAASFEPCDLGDRLAAIVDELLCVPNPIAQIFWRRHFQRVASATPLDARSTLRTQLCQRIRSHFVAGKGQRQSLIDLVARSLCSHPTPVAA